MKNIYVFLFYVILYTMFISIKMFLNWLKINQGSLIMDYVWLQNGQKNFVKILNQTNHFEGYRMPE